MLIAAVAEIFSVTESLLSSLSTSIFEMLRYIVRYNLKTKSCNLAAKWLVKRFRQIRWKSPEQVASVFSNVRLILPLPTLMNLNEFSLINKP